MAITVGYARVSTGNQRLDMQLDALTASGCTRVYTAARCARFNIAHTAATQHVGKETIVYGPTGLEITPGVHATWIA